MVSEVLCGVEGTQVPETVARLAAVRGHHHCIWEAASMSMRVGTSAASAGSGYGMPSPSGQLKLCPRLADDMS